MPLAHPEPLSDKQQSHRWPTASLSTSAKRKKGATLSHFLGVLLANLVLKLVFCIASACHGRVCHSCPGSSGCHGYACRAAMAQSRANGKRPAMMTGRMTRRTQLLQGPGHAVHDCGKHPLQIAPYSSPRSTHLRQHQAPPSFCGTLGAGADWASALTSEKTIAIEYDW